MTIKMATALDLPPNISQEFYEKPQDNEAVKTNIEHRNVILNNNTLDLDRGPDISNKHFGNTYELDISHSTIIGEKEDNDMNLDCYYTVPLIQETSSYGESGYNVTVNIIASDKSVILYEHVYQYTTKCIEAEYNLTHDITIDNQQSIDNVLVYK